MVSIEINDPKFKNPITYYMNDRLKNNLDKRVKQSLEKKDKDCVIAIDGDEGAGKSVLAFQLGKYVDPTLNLKRVCFTAEQFRSAIYKAKKGQCVIYDEAFTGLSSRASLSGINRMLISLMMQMRQRNLFVIIVLPTFFLLDRYAAIFRTRALIHVYENKGNRGYFKLYNKRLKKLIFLFGRSTYSYNIKKIKTKFRGRFYGKFALGDENVEKEYRKLKDKALKESEKAPIHAAAVKYKEQRDLLAYVLRKQTKLTYKKLANLIGEYGYEISYVQLRNLCGKFGDQGE